jgi:hypothetical protein
MRTTGRKDPADKRQWERVAYKYWTVAEYDTEDHEYYLSIARFEKGNHGRAWAEVFLKAAGMEFIVNPLLEPEVAWERQYRRDIVAFRPDGDTLTDEQVEELLEERRKETPWVGNGSYFGRHDQTLLTEAGL